MTDLEANKQINELITYKGYNYSIITDKNIEALNLAYKAIENIQKIKEITERALRSSDPINLYKACCINEIAEILGVKVEDPAPAADNNDNQITIDDIIEEG